MAKKVDMTWGGNTYRNVYADTTPVYSGSSSGGHIVTPPNTNNNSGGSGSGKSSGGKGGKQKVATSNTATQAVRSYSGGGGGGSSSADSGSDAYADYLKKLLKLSKNIYKQNMDAINKAYLGAGDTLRTNYDSTTGQLKDQFGYQNKLVNEDADNSMRQAYINSMLQKKDLGQKMSAMGLNGGATETTLASMNNRYSNARNNIDTTRQRSLADLNQTYQGNLADAMRQYNTAVNNLAMQRLEAENAARQAYLNMAMQFGSAGGSLGNISLPKTDYSSVLSNQSNYSYTPTAANNYVKGVNTTQSASIAQDNRSNYAQQLARQRLSGASDSEIKNAAYSAVQSGQMSGDELMNILNQLNVQV